jgi:MFS family permease
MPEPSAGEQRNHLYAFGLTALFNDVASEMAYWILPAFLVALGAGPTQLGIIEGLAESVASLIQLFSGYLADRLPQRKPIVVAGYFVANAVKPLLGLATSWWHVLAIRVTDRFSKGIRAVPRDVMVAQSAKKLGSAYGLIQAMDSAGAVLGPLAALLLLPHIGMRRVFWTAAIPGAICFLIALFWIREPAGVRREGDSKAEERSAHSGGLIPASSARLRQYPAFLFVLGVVTFFSLGNSSDMFLVLRAENAGILAVYAPLLGLIFNVLYTFFAWPAGQISDRVPRRAVAALGFLVFAAVYFVFGLAPSRLAIWLAMACYGLYYALTAPVLKALVIDSVSEDIRGRALGVFSFTTSVAILAASILAGQLWSRLGARVPFYLSSGIALLSAGLLLLAPVKRQTIRASR